MSTQSHCGRDHRWIRGAALALACGQGQALVAQAEVLRTVGDERIDLLGSALSYVPDLDGDGTPEVLVGAPSSYFAGVFPGRAMLHSGATGALLREWVTDVPNDYFGKSVASVGDVDGDGSPDVAIGAPLRARVFLYSAASGALIRSFTGASPPVSFGWAMAPLGDVDGDGVSDLVIGDSGVDVSVISTATGALIRRHPAPTDAYVFGSAVDAAGDVDGDGVVDYIVGSPIDLSIPPNLGLAFVYSGRTGQLIWTLEDPAQTAHPGWSVSGAGDVDGDGRADLLVADPYFSETSANGGKVWVFAGATGAVLFELTGSDSFEYFGRALSKCSDVDVDGIADLAIGSDRAVGSVSVYSAATGALLREFDLGAGCSSLDASADLSGDGVPDLLAGLPGAQEPDQGPWAGRAVVVSPVDGSVLFDVHGVSFIAECGLGLAVIPDRDGDGYREVAVGAPGGMGSSAGIVRILSGKDGHEFTTLSLGEGGDRFGQALTTVGDLTGDQIDEIAIGAPHSGGTGAVEIRSGADDSLVLRLAPTDGGEFGYSLAAATDASGTVFLAVGEPAHGAWPYSKGQVSVFDLTHGLLVLQVGGRDTGCRFGAAVAGAGDVNGDGFLDWAAGAPFEDGSVADAGSVRLFSGSDGSAIWRKQGDGWPDRLGASVAAIADLDGDGIGDILGGSPSAGPNYEGVVTAWSGVNGHVLFELTGPSFGVGFGAAVASIGDLNQDGAADFAIGAPQRVSGFNIAGSVFLYSGSTKSLLYHLDGDLPNGYLGQTLANVPWGHDARVDPDAVPDLLVGGPSMGAQLAAGYATLHHLDDLFLQVEPPAAAAGESVAIESRGGPAGNLAGLFAVAFDATPVNQFIAFGAFDALGNWSLQASVPGGLAGHTLTLRSFALGFSGKAVDSQDATLEFE